MKITGSRRAAVLIGVALLLSACTSAQPSTSATSATAASPVATPPPASTPTTAPTPAPAPTPTPTPAPLTERLTSPDANTRLVAVREVAGWADVAAVPILVTASTDDDLAVGIAAIEGLGAIGGPEATAALLAFVAEIPDDTDQDASGRAIAAVMGLGKVRGAAAIARLLELEADGTTPADLSVGTMAALAALEPADVPDLGKALKHRDAAVVVGAIHHLTSIGTAAAIDLVIGQIQSKSGTVRSAAIGDLALVGGLRATPALVKALAVKQTYSAATAALVQMHGGEATPLLRYLKSATTIRVYTAIIRIGQDGTEGALSTALAKFGYKTMALDYLNCGNPALDKAARTWASRHGYYVVTTPGAVGTVAWGR